MAFPEIFWSRTDFEELEIQEFSNSMNHVLEFHADLQKDQITTKKNMGELKKKSKYKNQMTTTKLTSIMKKYTCHSRS